MAAPFFALAAVISILAFTIWQSGDHPASAHQQKAAITQVLFNARTGNLEVAHRFYLHDVEHAMSRLMHPAADIYLDPEVQQRFANYVAAGFSIRLSENSAPLPLTLVGFEDERAYFWVYQEIKAPAGVASLVIEHNALRDIWREQLNTVNIEGRGALKTLSFTASDGAKKVFLDAS